MFFEAATIQEYSTSRISTRFSTIAEALTDIFMFSYLGQRIIQESSAVSDGIYNSNWYELAFSTQKKNMKTLMSMLQLSMLRASKPIKISAGGFMTLHLPSFMTVS